MSAVTHFSPEEHRLLRTRRALPRLLPIPLAALSMYAVGTGIEYAGWWQIAILTLFTSSMMFCWTSALHEAAHQTLWPSQWLSVWSGRILGTFMFTPYSVYREVHIRHHAYLNRPQDWELWPYSDPKASLAFRRAFAWFDLLLGVVAGPIIYGRMYFHRESPIRAAAMRRAVRNEYIAIVVVWGSIWTFVTLRHEWPQHGTAVLLPMAIAAVLQTGRKFTEHLGMRSFDPLLGTRTVVPRKWLMKLSSYLNFDIFVHGPHHRHPRMVHTMLEATLSEFQEGNPQTPVPSFDRYWRAILDMAPFLFRNPGCGANVPSDLQSVVGRDVPLSEAWPVE